MAGRHVVHVHVGGLELSSEGHSLVVGVEVFGINFEVGSEPMNIAKGGVE